MPLTKGFTGLKDLLEITWRNQGRKGGGTLQWSSRGYYKIEEILHSESAHPLKIGAGFYARGE
jgi:hypothetical protein